MVFLLFLIFASAFSSLAAPVAALPPSIPDPCRQTIESLPTGSLDPNSYLEAATCLLRQDSLNAPRPSASGFRSGRADSVLKARLPENQGWYLDHLQRFRTDRDIARFSGMAFLAELKHPDNAALYRVLAEAYQMIPDPYRAGLAYLRFADLDSTQSGFIQYQLENLVRTSATDTPPAQLLDSLTAGFPHTHPRTAEILESLCWGSRDYPCAYRNFLAQLAFGNPGPAASLERVNRFQSQGYFDDAAAILEKIGWRNLTQPWQSMARTLHLQIRNQLKDWPAIVAEVPTASGSARGGAFSEEESFIIATALVKIGKADQALPRLQKLENGSAPPWGYRSRLLKAQALMALGKSREAAQTLTSLKRDPHRQEGTGPILFWQGCLAVDQGRFAAAESLMVLASAYTGSEEAQRALEYRFFLMQDTGTNRPTFFRGLPESPHSPAERMQSLEKVSHGSALWPYARLEKAQIFVQTGHPDSAEAVLDDAARRSPDRIAGLQAEAKAAFLQEKLSGGRQAALARYEDLLIKYQQGVIPEFSRGRIRALK